MIQTVTKRSDQLTLRDLLSRLTFVEAVKLLGDDGKRLIQQGGKHEILIDEQVYLGGDLFRLSLDGAVVTITLMAPARKRLYFQCSRCDRVCEHVGAAFSLILEDKMALGLAAPPEERAPLESLAEEELARTALAEREERARTEKMSLASADPSTPWTDYTVTSATSGKTYRVALRGLERGVSYCSCPDFRKNTLGTCKHILSVLAKVKRRFGAAALARPHVQKTFSVHLRYGDELELRMSVPRIRRPEVEEIVRPLRDRPIEDVHDLLARVARLEAAGRDVTIYPDAEEHIQKRLFEHRMRRLVEGIRADPAAHPLRKTLLKTELLPYQLDGVAFAVGAGRAVLADDMGLGKTIQGVGVAEVLAREAGIKKVLVVCPASVKSQWRAEIARFSHRDCHLVAGAAKDRAEQYAGPAFFCICNYEQVLRDILAIEAVKWDLVILDEGQRIKNWEAQTSRIVKGLRSPFALVLSGTPLENRLDELFSVVEFIDERRLGPAFRFFHRHRIVDEKGRVQGYKSLGELRERLKPILLRRTRAAVMRDLPPRTTEVVRIPPTDEQSGMHAGWMQVVSTIVRKKFITEMDLLRLQKALLMCRMVANSTYLVDKSLPPPGHSTKIEKLEEILDQLRQEEDRKVLLFSEWTTMLDLIQEILKRLRMAYVRLDGSVPQRKRQSLVREFQETPECKVFCTTNAGSTGLNLQAANTVVNVDLPWNPAVLEQRVGRAHRMGQKRPVQVFVLVTEGTIEERLLGTLSAKHELATAALDFSSDVDEVDLSSGVEELRRRLEVLLGAKPEAPVDESEKRRAEDESRSIARGEHVAAAGGQLLGAAFSFLRALLPARPETDASREAASLLKRGLESCVSEDEQGRPRLTLTLPDKSVLEDLARTLAGALAAAAQRPAPPEGGPGRN
ncbi:MAG: DEAD/DEAH box helicase [Planctomycetes bacterium]|nr:DEAD/DEAH box helicase [Planctomycetota bacterium]